MLYVRYSPFGPLNTEDEIVPGPTINKNGRETQAFTEKSPKQLYPECCLLLCEWWGPRQLPASTAQDESFSSVAKSPARSVVL